MRYQQQNQIEPTCFGQCLCQNITFKIYGPLSKIVYCHCRQCRVLSGNFVSVVTVKDKNLDIADAKKISWFASSNFAKRGFCNQCGTALFFKHQDSDAISIHTGCLDETNFKQQNPERGFHIFVTEKGPYYEINDGLQQFPYHDKR
ncbi:MAG: GFA family protein [Pseudomonadota bacterium]